MATLSVSELLMDTMDAFKVQFPMITAFSTDFSSATAKKDDTITGHVSTLPSVQSYDATTGYEANAAESSSLITDVPVTLDRLRHVPVKVDYLDQISSKKDLYQEAIRNQAFVLGKSVVDYVLSLVLAANFTYSETESEASTTKQTLDTIAGDLNANGAAPVGRFGIVNTNVYNSLESDARIASGDYHGQMRSSNGYGSLVNVSGFGNIWEYPDLPSNSENLTGFFGTKNAAVIASRAPTDPSAIAAANGIPQIANFETITDPDSGLTMFAIQWQKSGLFDVYTTVGLLYGAKAGAQAGGANAIVDQAGVRLKSA